VQEEAAGPDVHVDASTLETVRGMLELRCAPCHSEDSDSTRARASFDGGSSLARVRAELVDLDDPDFSDLVWVIEDGSMPPEDSDHEPVTPEEEAAVLAWVRAGAPLDDELAHKEDPGHGELQPTGQEPAQEAEEKPPGGDEVAAGGDVAEPGDDGAEPEPGRLGQLVRRAHPTLVHFPIALFLAAFLAELLQGSRVRPGLAAASRFCLWIAALSALAAAYSGWGLAEERRPDELLERHRWLGGTTAVLGLLCLFTCELHGMGQRPRWKVPMRVLLLFTAAAVGIAGHLGGTLVYGEGWWTP